MALTETSRINPDVRNTENTNSRQAPVRIGLWGWLGIYITGAILLILILFHVGMIHYASSQPFSWSRTAEALRSPLVRCVEFSLLVFALIHGMMGLRRLILDLEIFKRRGSPYLTLCLTGVAVILLLWGLQIFRHLTAGV